jgi:hypothetical protein
MLSMGCAKDGVCPSRIEAMRTALAAIPPPDEYQDAYSLRSVGPMLAVPELASSAGEPMGGGRRLYVYADGARNFEGTPIASDSELDIVLGSQGHRDFGPPPILHLALEPGTKVRAVAPLLRLAKRAELRVLFRAPASEFSPPIPPALAAKIEAMRRDPRAQAAMFDAALKAAIGGCETIERAFAEIADPMSRVGKDRQAVLLNAVVAGAESCGCNTVDVDALTVLVWWIFSGHGPIRELALRVDPAGTQLGPDAGVDELVKALAAGPVAFTGP